MKIAFVLLASLVAAEDCVDSAEETTDSGGDGCSWYENNRSQCGWWDTSAFTASTMCCSCENPHPEADDCVDNTDKEDAGGDKCEWYSTNWNSCGDWDTDEFTASTMCCACYSGPSDSTCEETQTDSEDTGGDGCSWYWANQETCT